MEYVATSLRASPYCRTVELSRCEEEPSNYVLRIGRTSIMPSLNEWAGGSPAFDCAQISTTVPVRRARSAANKVILS